MESQNFGHQHPLVFNQDESNQSEAAHCSRCGEVMSGPSFSCAECGFYLHKECADAPSEISHPFHRDHPLCLLPNPPATYKQCICSFCGEACQMFVYHCSCEVDLHIKCALFTYNIAEKNFGDLQGIAYKDPSLSTEINNEQLQSFKCFGCWESLFDSAYYSLDTGFNLHKKCAELSFEIYYPHHYEHLLILQFSVGKLPCIICYDIKYGLSYCCSLCNFAIHIACLSPPSIIEGKGHQHPFTLFLRQMTFTCDACGVERNSVPYMCSNCNLLVHKKCISLPPIIKFAWHEHPIFHTYFIPRHESMSKNWDCVICLEEVNTKHGSYYCSKCHFIVHVNCVTKIKKWYYVIDSEEKFDDNSILSEDSYIVIERNEGGEAEKIEHFSHEHNLMLSDKILDDDKFCDGCTLLLSDSFYCCSECNFFLHKKCVEFPKRQHLWFHLCRELLILITSCIFKCDYCGHVCNGFTYKCSGCRGSFCLRCAIPYNLTCEGHEHPLSILYTYKGSCTSCAKELNCAYICKICKFALCLRCIRLPSKARHKSDEHLLALTYRDDNIYSESYFCDLCEEGRNPSHWFYYCTICDTCAHVSCVIGKGKYPFIKLGKIYKEGEHPHPLVLVKKKYYYPECSVCDYPCQELAVECTELGCEYIVHWDCIRPSQLRE